MSSLMSSVSSDEFDALAQLHGVLCAFLLSISIGVQYSVTADALQFTTFMGALGKHQGFRSYAHHLLNRSGYDFDLVVGVDETMDMEYELLHGFQERWPWQQPEACWHDNGCLTTSSNVLPKLLTDNTFNIMLPVLFEDFPQKYTLVYLNKHPKAYRVMYNSLLSALATAFLIAGLICNVTTYVTYLLSPANKSMKADAAFKRIGLPLLMFQYFMLVVSVTLMSYAGSYVLSFNTPFAKEELWINFYYYSFAAYSPPLFIVLPGSILAYHKSKRAMTADVHPSAAAEKDGVEMVAGGTSRE